VPDAIVRAGGTVAKFTVDGLMAYFGSEVRAAPTTAVGFGPVGSSTTA
jgi:class 3 adenylate cyclase